jgi:hypothetical protein
MSRRTLLFVGSGVLGAVLVGLLILLVVRGGDDGTLAAKTSVAGVDLGGLDRKEAIEKLTSELAPRTGEPMVVSVGDQRETIRPADAGLSVDVPATVDEALRNGGVLDRLGGQDLAPVVRVDSPRMRATVKSLAGKFDSKTREGAIEFKGAAPVIHVPQAGVSLDQSGAAEAVRKGFLTTTDPVELPADLDRPKISAEEVERAKNEQAKPAVAAPLTIADGDRSVDVAPARLTKFLSFAATSDGKLELKVDGKGLADEVDEKLGTLRARPVDATFRIVGGKPQVVPARPSTRLPSSAPRRRSCPTPSTAPCRSCAPTLSRTSRPRRPSSSASSSSCRPTRSVSPTPPTGCRTSAPAPAPSTARCSSPATSTA